MSVEERLAKIERCQTQNNEMLRNLTEKVEERNERNEEWMKRLSRLIYGSNGAKGVLVHLALLQDSQERTRWLMRTIMAAMIVLVAGGAWSFFTG